MRGSFHSRGTAQPSALAIALCMLIVAGAVLFGIFGPGIAQRSQLGGRVTLGELVAAAAALGDGFHANALRSRVPSLDGADRTDDAGSRESVEHAIRSALGTETTVPDLSPHRFSIASSGAVALRNERPDAFAIFYLAADRRRSVTLVLAPDDGRAFIFDDFGRPIPLDPGRLVEERLDRFPRDDSVALVWSDGSLLHIAIVPSEDDAAAMRAALGAP